MSGLTVGFMSIDTLILELKLNNGTNEEKYYAEKILNITNNHHWLLVTLLLCNSFCAEAMPIVLHKLVGEAWAIILSVTFIVIPSKYFSNKYMFIGYEDKEKLVVTKNNSMNRVSLFAFDEKKIKNNKNSNKVIKVICNLIKNKIFIFSSLTRAIIFFTFQIIHVKVM